MLMRFPWTSWLAFRGGLAPPGSAMLMPLPWTSWRTLRGGLSPGFAMLMRLHRATRLASPEVLASN
jgi:hypothetical protein